MIYLASFYFIEMKIILDETLIKNNYDFFKMLVKMFIVNEAKVDKKEYMSRWLIGPWNSSSKTEFGVAFIEPEQLMQKHMHTQVEEIIYVVEGDIVLLLEKNTHRVLTKGTAVFIPPKQVHGLQNRSNRITKLILEF